MRTSIRRGPALAGRVICRAEGTRDNIVLKARKMTWSRRHAPDELEIQSSFSSVKVVSPFKDSQLIPKVQIPRAKALEFLRLTARSGEKTGGQGEKPG